VASSKPKRTWSSRFSGAYKATRDALTFKPREVPADDPVRLSGQPATPQPAVYVSAARVYESQGRANEAAEQYNRALAANPLNVDALVGLARLKHREGDLTTATELYQRALRSNADNAVVLNDLGLCYARQNMLQQARSSMEKAVAQDRRSKLYRNNLAVVLVEMNDPQSALGHLKAVHGEAVAHYNLGYMLSEKGQHQAAAHHLQTALAIEPRMEPARQMLARLEPRPGAGPQLGAPHVAPADMPNYTPPEAQPRRDMPVNYRQTGPVDTYVPHQPARAVNGNSPSNSGYAPPSQGYAPPAQPTQSLPPDQSWVPQDQQQPQHGGNARFSLNDSTLTPTPQPVADVDHRPTVNYVQPPIGQGQPPANYALPNQAQPQPEPAPAAPLPGELPEYLRGQATRPQVPSNGGSRWSN
jgi:tetratricopeptide (TPR) repeat protein